MPRLDEYYSLAIEVMANPKAEDETDEYFQLDLPVAPAVIVGEETVVEVDEKLVTVTKEDKLS